MVKYHVGCGKRDWPGWTNIDGIDFPHVTHHDVTLKQLLPDQIDLIYASHLFEYWDREEGLEVLKYWHKALKPGGVLRLAVPDWDNMILALTYNDFKLKDILGPLYGRMMMGDQLIYHKTVYNYDDLRAILNEAGFKTVRRYDWRDTEHAQFDDQSKAHLPHDPEAIATGKFDSRHILISLNVEAIK